MNVGTYEYVYEYAFKTPFFLALLLRQDPKLCQLVNIGTPTDPLEEKTVTMVYGTDFVNLTFKNFCCAKKELAKVSSIIRVRVPGF